MSALEVVPWELSLKHLQQLTNEPCSRQVEAAVVDELLRIYDMRKDKVMPQSACRKLVDELKVCWGRNVTTVMHSGGCAISE